MREKTQATPKLSGCRLESPTRLVISFDRWLLGDEAVHVKPGKVPGRVPLELKVGAAVPIGPKNTSGWVFATSLEVINTTAIAVTIPAGVDTPTAVRYAWGDYPCCPGIDLPGRAYGKFCPPAACPIVSETTEEPAVPFFAYIEGGKCRCDDPWACSE
jgi:hypothetical protein